MDEREILRYYTISDEELQIINQQRGTANRLGFAIQIAYLRFPERPLSINEIVPNFIVHTIAKQLRVLPPVIQNYVREPAHRKIFKQLKRNLTSSQFKQLDNLFSVGKRYKFSYLSCLRQPSIVIFIENPNNIMYRIEFI